MKPHLEKRSLTLSGHRTSLALEPEFWSALEALAHAQNTQLTTLITEQDTTRPPETPLASHLRRLTLTAALNRKI